MSAEQTKGFDAKLNSYYFKEYLTAVDSIVDEAVIRVTDSGIETKAVDPANVAMVEAKLGFGAFVENEGGEQAFGVNTRRLSSLVDDFEAGSVSLDFEPEPRKLNFGTGPYHYTHSCLDPDSIRKEPNIPKMDLSFSADIEIDKLSQAIEWFDEFTTRVRVRYATENGKFWIEAMERDRSGDVKTDDGVFELDRSELEQVRELGEADSHFSLDYLKDIIDAVPDGYPVTITIGEEFPLTLSYKIGWEETGPGEGVAHGEVKFMQAPRIQT
jgi:proliferating cell nuclear antigen